MTAATRWVPNSAGEAALVGYLGRGMTNFTTRVRDNARAISPRTYSGHHAPASYRKTIQATTFVNGVVVDGSPIRAVGFNPDAAAIRGIVYSTSFLAHLLEITGAQPHDIPNFLGRGGTFHHPGFTRKPHFVPGLFMAVSDAGASFRGKVLVP